MKLAIGLTRARSFLNRLTFPAEMSRIEQDKCRACEMPRLLPQTVTPMESNQ